MVFAGDFMKWLIGIGWDGFRNVELGIVRIWTGGEGG